MPFGNRLKEARIMKGLTQEELAHAVNVTKGAIGNYESEVSSPKEPILIRLMQVLNVDANFLFQDLVNIRPSIALSSEETAIVLAYRSADDASRAGVRKLLDLPAAQKKEKSELSAG